MSCPNILVIHTDQHRWDCLGAYGNPDIKTPHLDALSSDGVVYENAFCSFPVCTPSRYSLLSGLHVHQHQGWTNHCTLNASIPTFPKALRSAGYATAAVGKMHFTPTYLDVGFDTMLLAEQDGPGRFDDDYHRWLMEEGLCDVNDLEDQRHEYRKSAGDEYWESRGALTSNLDEEHHSTTWIGDRSVELVENWGESGNLLMVGFIKPHHPFDPPKPWNTMYDPDALSLVPGWTESCLDGDLAYSKGYFPHAELTEPVLRQAMAYYYATISQIDFQVGRLIKTLKDRGVYDDTMIVFTSDHGDYLGFHHMMLKSNHMYDPVMRVPLIVKYPEGTQAGTREGSLTCNVDLAPTILNIAGIDVPKLMPGVDLCDGPELNAFVTATNSKNCYMIRTATDKLIYHRNLEHCRYFDLENDPLEFDDKFNDPNCAMRVQELRNQLADWLMFAVPTPTHLDTESPTISGPNQAKGESDGPEAVAAYFKRAMGKSD